jgi:MFS family permease
MTGGAIQITISGLVGYLLADDKSLATFPITFYVLGTLISTMPASMFMRYVGRRRGFQIGALMGLTSASLAVYAIYQSSFWLFCFALMLTGTYQAFAQYYRFAAADTASEEFRPKAISWVLLGGLAAAIAGPQIVIYTKDALAPVMYAGAFAASAVTAFIAMLVVTLIDIPKAPATSLDGEPPRPLKVIFGQRKLKIAIFSGMVSYASMTFVMTATPLAMVASSHSVESAAFAIQWHVLAMFAPSFFTGNLIARFGREPIILFGLFLLGCAGLVAVSGDAIWQYNLAMILLGLGWNFGYIGSSTLVTDCHRPEERNKVQGINEFMVFGLVAVASFSSGKLLHDVGWETLTISYLPLVAVAAGLVLMLALRSKEQELRKS